VRRVDGSPFPHALTEKGGLFIQAERAKIILISPVVPYPTDQGARETMLSLIRMLSGSFDVTVLSLARSREEMACAREIESLCARVIAVMAPSRKSLFHRIVYGLFYRLKSTIMRRSMKQMVDCPGVLLREARALSQEPFDLVIVCFWQLQRAARLFPRERTVLLTFEIDLLINHQISLLERNLVKKIGAVRRWLMERPEELHAYRAANRVWTLTDGDREVVDRICRGRCTAAVLPFGVDVDFHAPSGMQRNEGEVLFLGRLDEPSSRDALEYFIRKIYPRVDDVPGISITIVGDRLPSDVEFFGLLPEVEVVGRVSDVRPYLHRASCLVAPARFGGGLRISVLLAMAAALPVVASPVAMNGLPFEAETEYLSAADPEEYARQIRRVLAAGADVERMAGAASRRLRLDFGMGRQEEKVVALVREAIG
jgi:glycosyltransferase involved in cell wall biosynthesis